MTAPKSPVQYVVDPITGCWEWQRTLAGPGKYGQLRIGPGGKRKQYAHIYFWEQRNGPVPKGLELDHLCRNNRCCNPAHLEAVPHVVNVRRGRSTILTRSQVDEIVAIGYGKTAAEIGKMFGVSGECIAGIRRGRNWGTPVDPGADVGKGERNGTAKLKNADVLVIRKRFSEGESMRSLSRQFGVSRPVISGIVKKTLWRHI